MKRQALLWVGSLTVLTLIAGCSSAAKNEPTFATNGVVVTTKAFQDACIDRGDRQVEITDSIGIAVAIAQLSNGEFTPAVGAQVTKCVETFDFPAVPERDTYTITGSNFQKVVSLAEMKAGNIQIDVVGDGIVVKTITPTPIPTPTPTPTPSVTDTPTPTPTRTVTPVRPRPPSQPSVEPTLPNLGASITSAYKASSGECLTYSGGQYSLRQKFYAVLEVRGTNAQDPWEPFNRTTVDYGQAQATGSSTTLSSSKTLVRKRFEFDIYWKTNSSYSGSYTLRSISFSNGIDFIKSLSLPGGLTFSKSGCKSLS